VLVPLPTGGQAERERNQKLPGVRRQVRSNQGGKTHVWYSDVLVMKITSVRSFLLSYPLESPLKLEFHGGERTILKRDAMLIRIGTDKGLVGYAPGPGSEIAHAAIEKNGGAVSRRPHSGRSGRAARTIFRATGLRPGAA